MSCSTNTLTQLGSDTFVRANGALGSNWITPIELPQAVTIDTNTAYGGNNAGNNAEAQWNGGAIPSDQYAELQWEYPGVLGQHFDLTFRRDTTNNFAYWVVSFTHGSTSAFLDDNNGVFEDLFTLSSPLATGDKVRVSMLGTQYCVFRDTGSGYALEHSGTLPSVLPTSGTVAGNPGFDLSALGRASNFATGSVADSSPCASRQIINGGFQDVMGNSLALGYLTFRLQQDAANTCGTVQTCAGRLVTVPLDVNGNVAGSIFLQPTSVMTPAGTYDVIAYTATGLAVWRNPVFQLPAGSTPFSLS